MDSYIDIHAHILPKADDGAKNIEQSLSMLRIAMENGIGEMIVTPHNYAERKSISPSEIAARAGELEEKAKEHNISVRLYTGNELYYRSELAGQLEKGDVCTLAYSSYILVEFDPMEHFSYMRDGLSALSDAGYYPILAHTERYQTLHPKSNIFFHAEKVEELIKRGIYIQVNSGSITGRFGTSVRRFTQKLLKQRRVHFVATDAHNDQNRAPYMKECAVYLKKKYGREYIEEILYQNPKKIIVNERI